MRTALRVILAAAIAGAYALADGYLSLRADALRAGVDLGWRNDPYVVGPHFPVLYSSLIAVLTVLVLPVVVAIGQAVRTAFDK